VDVKLKVGKFMVCNFDYVNSTSGQMLEVWAKIEKFKPSKF